MIFLLNHAGDELCLLYYVCNYILRVALLFYYVFLSELEAYAGVISALRAQGDLTKDKKDLLGDLTKVLG